MNTYKAVNRFQSLSAKRASLQITDEFESLEFFNLPKTYNHVEINFVFHYM